ncbi:MAG: CotH kinase family protein, partial [Patescibacteria group bacterium]|nr:CotH kinase family protein [Patescibacteria group bacterium]
SLSYLTEPIRVRYYPEKFEGPEAKSTVIFKFYDPDGNFVSNLTYVLNGATDHWANINTIAGGISFITNIRNNHKVGEISEVSFDNILKDQNNGAKRIGAPALKKENISKVELELWSWYSPAGGDVKVSYEGWERYAYVDSNVNFKFIDVLHDENLQERSPIYKARYFPSDGQKYLELSAPLHHFSEFTQKINLEPGTEYILLADARVRAGKSSPIIEIVDSQNNTLFSESLDFCLGQAGWYRFGGVFSSNGSEALLKLKVFNALNKINSDRVDFDNIWLIKVPSDYSRKRYLSDIAKVFNIKEDNKNFIPTALDYSKLYGEEFANELSAAYDGLGVPIYDLYFDENKFYSGDIKSDKIAATLVYNGNSYKTKMRVRGDYGVHSVAPVKSLRIDFSGSESFYGKSSINLIRPLVRGFINEEYSYYVAAKLGLINLDNQFVFLRVNGRPYGLMHEMEQWSEELLEKNQKPLGDLYSGEGDDMGTEAHINAYKKVTPVFWDKYTKDPFQNKNDNTNILLLINFLDWGMLDKFEAMINMEKFLIWNAHAILVGSTHQDQVHNNRFYFDNTYGGFEPIPWDMRAYYGPEQIGNIIYNTFADFLLKDINVFDKRNKILWDYVTDKDNVKDDRDYYKQVLDQIKKPLEASEIYSWGAEEIDNYKSIEKSLEDTLTLIAEHDKQIADLLSKNNVLSVNFLDMGKGDDGELLVKMAIEPELEDDFSSSLLRGISLGKKFAGKSLSIYEDSNKDGIFDLESDALISSLSIEDRSAYLGLGGILPSKFYYNTYINIAPYVLSVADFKQMSDSGFLNDEEKSLLSSAYEFDEKTGAYYLYVDSKNSQLIKLFKKVDYIPGYTKSVYFLKVGGVGSIFNVLSDVKIDAVNATTGSSLEINSEARKMEGSIKLSGVENFSDSLSLSYLTEPIRVRYYPEKFEGPEAKSTVIFKFYDPDGNFVSNLTYVLNGATDHWANINTIAGGISFITNIRNNHKVGEISEVSFDNILKDQNNGAKRIGAPALKKENISKVELELWSWYSPAGGDVKVSYEGWERYLVASVENDVFFSGATLDDIFDKVEKVQEPNVSDMETYKYLDKSLYTTDQFAAEFGFLKRSADSPNEFTWPQGGYKVEEDMIIPKGIILIFEPGTKIKIAPDVSVVSYGEVRAIGTEDEPIVFTSMPWKKGWGTFALLREGARGIFEHCTFENGNDAYINGIYFSGMLSVYHADASVKKCKFQYASEKTGDDALNFKNGLFTVEDSYFYKNKSDAIDFDFSKEGSKIINNYFLKNGGDSIDVSGSNFVIENNRIVKSGDKCISIGEKSDAVIKNNILEKCNYGVAVKDSSSARIINNSFIKNKVGVASYNKKEIFGGGKAFVYNAIFNENRQDFGVEEIEKSDNRSFNDFYKSTCIVYNSKYKLSGAKTREVIKEPKKKLPSKKQLLIAYLTDTLEDVGYKFATLVNKAEEGLPEDNPFGGLPAGVIKN